MENITIKEISTTLNKEDFDDIYSFAEKDGIKIKTSSDTNRYEGSKLLHNLLKLHTSLIWYGLVVVEFLLLALFMSSVIPFDAGHFGMICLFAAAIPVLALVVYLLNTRHSVKDLPRFKDVIELSLIIAISAIIVTIALSSILEVDFKNISDVYYYIITPVLVIINVPLYFVVKYTLAKSEHYQTI